MSPLSTFETDVIDTEDAVQERDQGTAQNVIPPRIAEAFGNQWDFFPEEEQKRFMRLLSETEISPRTEGTNRRFNRSTLVNLVRLFGMCADRGIDVNVIAKIADLWTLTELKKKIDRHNEGASSEEQIPLLSEEEMKLLPELVQRIDAIWKGYVRNIKKPAHKKMIAAWLRLQRKAALRQDIPGGIRVERKLPVHRTSRLEKNFVGMHTHELLPEDMHSACVSPEADSAMRVWDLTGEEPGESVLPNGQPYELHSGEESASAAIEVAPHSGKTGESPATDTPSHSEVAAQLSAMNEHLHALMEKTAEIGEFRRLMESNLDAMQRLLSAPSHNGEGPKQSPHGDLVIAGNQIRLSPDMKGTITITELRIGDNSHS